MKFRYLLFFIFFLSLTFPIYSENFTFSEDFAVELKQYQKEIEENIIISRSTKAKKEMLDALYRVKNNNEIRDADAIIDFGISMRDNMKFLPNREKVSFLKYLRKELADETLISRADWYFLTEESLAKPNFTKTSVVRAAETFVDKLHEILFSGNSKNLENATRVLKQDIIKLVSQGDVELLETFINTYALQANNYGEMSRSLNIFLSELMNHNLPLTLMKNTAVPSESLARHTIPALMQQFTWDSFLTNNQGILLQDMFKSKTINKFHLSDFTKMIGDTYLDKTIPQEERELLSKMSVLNDFAKVSNPTYQELKPQARFGTQGQRSLFRQEALEINFGDLTPQNAKELSKMIKAVPTAKMETVLPNSRGWIESFSRWAEKSIKPKSNVIITIGTMIGLVVAEELIRSYTDYNPSNTYLTVTDEITDAIAIGNNIKLVYNTVYYDNFAKYFLTYAEEGNLTEDEQLAYIETYDNFERALYANYFQDSENNIAELDWQCFALNENCPTEA